jgi:hypothetical protein
VAGRQLATELGQSLSALVVGLGVDQVSDSLGLGQIQPTALKGPPGEFAWFGVPQSQIA